MELLKLVGAIRSCQGKNINPLRRMKASGELMDFLEDYPVFAAVPGLSPILEEAERINQAAVEEVFGRKPARAAAAAMLGADSAEVSVEFHGTLTSPFASPVSSPVLPSPQPAAMPKPTDAAMLQPADAAMLQPADATAAFEVVLPQPADCLRGRTAAARRCLPRCRTIMER